MDAARLREIAEKLEALDNGLYDDVLDLIQESRRLAVEEYRRSLLPPERKLGAHSRSAPEPQSIHDKRKRKEHGR